jgi:hypothetical protein
MWTLSIFYGACPAWKIKLTTRAAPAEASVGFARHGEGGSRFPHSPSARFPLRAQTMLQSLTRIQKNLRVILIDVLSTNKQRRFECRRERIRESMNDLHRSRSFFKNNPATSQLSAHPRLRETLRTGEQPSSYTATGNPAIRPPSHPAIQPSSYLATQLSRHPAIQLHSHPATRNYSTIVTGCCCVEQ